MTDHLEPLLPNKYVLTAEQKAYAAILFHGIIDNNDWIEALCQEVIVLRVKVEALEWDLKHERR